MSLETFATRLVVGRVLKGAPMLKRLVDLLVHTPGFKRGLAAVCATASVVFRHVGAMLRELCDLGLAVESTCRLDVGSWAQYADAVATIANQWLVPTLDAVTIVSGVVGVAHGLMRKKG